MKIRMNPLLGLTSITAFAFILNGCIAYGVAKTAVNTTVGVTKTAVKGTGKVVGAIIPEGKEEKEKEDTKD